MPRLSSVTVFFPAYNDAGTIPAMILRALRVLPAVADDYEVVVINDGSTDDTGAILDELARHLSRLRVIHHAQPSGYGGVLRAGFAAARKDWIFYTDGDAQYDARELTDLAGAVAAGVDMVQGYKIKRHDPFHRVVIGLAYQYFVKFLFGLTIRDVDCDFRLIRRRCFQAVSLESHDGTLPLEMVKKFTDAGFHFVEVPVHHFHRVYGRSQFFNLPRLLRVVRDILRLWLALVWRKEHLSKTEQPAGIDGGGVPVGNVEQRET